MSKISFIFLLGIIVAILPVTGFSGEWKTIFFVIIGLTVSISILFLRGEIHSLRKALKSRDHTVTDSFVQNSHIDTYGRTHKTINEGHAKNIIN